MELPNDPLLNPGELQRFLRTRSLPPLERFGQRFLVNQEVLADIVAAAETDPAIPMIEIGAGLGVLTRALASARERKTQSTKRPAAPLIAVELDRRLISHLLERTREFPSVRVVHADILRAEISSLLPNPDARRPVYDVVGNIPYNITAPILRKFLAPEPQKGPPPRPQPSPPKGVGVTTNPRLRQLTLLVDDAVAAAIAARPPQMSVRAVSIQVYAEPSVVRRRIPPAVFVPPPAVFSAILTLVTRTSPLVSPAEERQFFRLVRAGFSQRRKVLANALAATYHLAPPEAATRLRRAGIDPRRRAETLSIAEWRKLLAVWEGRDRTRLRSCFGGQDRPR